MQQSGQTVAVIGAGIVGLSTAIQLRRAGFDVIVIDRAEPMQACSAGNAGYLSEANIFPPAAPDMLWQIPKLLLAKDGPLVIRTSYLGRMLPWMRKALKVLKPGELKVVTDSLAAMTVRAYDAVVDLATEAQAASLLSRKGGLIAFKTAAALDKKAASIPKWNGYGLKVRRLSAADMLAMEPALVESIVGGLLFENSGRCANPQRLGQLYAAHLQRHGVQFLRDEVRSIETPANGGVSVQASDSRIRFDQVVVCSGYWSGELMRPFYAKVPIVSERGYHLMLPVPQVQLQRPIVFGEPHFAATPMEHGLRLAGTAEFSRWDASPTWPRAHMLLTLARKYLRHLDGAQAKPWMGIRPSLPDGLPAIGTVPGAPGLHYAFGHAHNGLTLSAVTAQCVSALVQGTPPPVPVAPMALERFN